MMPCFQRCPLCLAETGADALHERLRVLVPPSPSHASGFGSARRGDRGRAPAWRRRSQCCLWAASIRVGSFDITHHSLVVGFACLLPWGIGGCAATDCLLRAFSSTKRSGHQRWVGGGVFRVNIDCMPMSAEPPTGSAGPPMGSAKPTRRASAEPPMVAGGAARASAEPPMEPPVGVG